MRNIYALVFTVLLAASLAKAGGFRCRAVCVLLDPDSQSLTFLGSVSQAADLDRKMVFQSTEEKCVQRAHRHGYSGQSALLVKNISFSSWQKNRSVEERDERGSASSQAAQSVQRSWYHYRVDQSAAAESSYNSHSYSEWERQKSLAATPDFFWPQDCQLDKDIRKGTLPFYTGDKHYYP